MNREAVALAADSATTIFPDSANRMVFPTQNKLFALSSFAPVGIMVYGAGAFMGIPWDTLVKDFRRNHASKTYPDLPQYASAFCDHLQRVANNSLNEDDRRALAEIHAGDFSGLVIAGFGDNNLFPVVQERTISGIVTGKLQVQIVRTARVSPSISYSHVLPFAQWDMATLFMLGIAPEYSELLKASLEQVLNDYTEVLLSEFEFDSDDERQEFVQDSAATYPQVFEVFMDSLTKQGLQTYARPILDVVSGLPKEQLADLAEALINLTTLKRQVSPSDASVGGPTDVALISKGDGFIWIKRKHYFPPQLNHAYFARTYGEGGGRHGTQDEGLSDNATNE